VLVQLVQGAAGNKKGEFGVDAQFFLANYIQKMVIFLLKLLLKGTKHEAQFLTVAVSYCPRPATP
jgi:hypothetical protein